MGAVKMHRNNSLPAPGTMAADQVRFVKVGSSYIQYVIDNSGVAIPPAVMAHTHNISDVTGLQTALDGKSDTSHVHANATITVSGFMSAADKSKLDGLSNYTHPSSGVTPGTYRSVTVDTMGHVTAGTNPTTLAEYGITQKYVSLNPSDGFATPVQSSYDLNTAALTAYGYATSATNRPTGAAANGYFSINAIDSTSFFQTFANPTVQDAFFFRRRNTSTNYAWLQVASREWVATQISGTTGRIGKFTGANTIGDSLLSESGIGIIANGGVFVSDVPHNSNIRGFSLWASGLNRWVFGKAGTESGSDSGSDYVMWCYNDAGAFLREPMRISRATGNVTFTGTLTASGGNSTQWNAAVPGTRTITINGTTFDLSANRSWTVSGGLTGSGSTGYLAKWNAGALDQASIEETSNSLDLKKAANIGKNGTNQYLSVAGASNSISIGFYNPAGTNAYSLYRFDDQLTFSSSSGYTIFQVNNDNFLTFVNPTGAQPFKVNSITRVDNLNVQYLNGNADTYFTPAGRTLTINGTTFDLSANRSWTVTGGIGGSGTTGRLPKFSASTTLADSLLSESGINITANGGIFVTDTPTNSNVRGYTILNGGLTRWSFGKAGSESGSDSGSDFTLWSYSDAGSFVREPLRISRASGNATFSGTIAASGGNSGNWNSAYNWGNHASVGYVPGSRTITINGVTQDLSSNRSWTISGGGSLTLAGLNDVVISSPAPYESLVYISGMWRNYSLGGISGSGSTSKFTKWSGTNSVSAVEMYESGNWIVVGSEGTRRDLIIQGSLVPKQMTASERASYSPGFYGALVMQIDGTDGLYRSKDNGSGGVTWVYIG